MPTLFKPTNVQATFRREVTNIAEFYSTLSYYTDTGVDERVTSNNPVNNPGYSLTVALTSSKSSNNDLSYIYPKALFYTYRTNTNDILQYQVYPPIIYCSELSGIGYQYNHTDCFRMEIVSNGFEYLNNTAQDKDLTAYIVQGAFRLYYNTAYLANGINDIQQYTATIDFPTFNPMTDSNQNKYAYVKNDAIFIKDSNLPRFPIISDPQQMTMQWGSRIPRAIENVALYYTISLNPDIFSNLQTKFDRGCFAIQTDNHTLRIGRRSCKQDIGYYNSAITIQLPARTGSIFRYYYNGSEIRTSTRITLAPTNSTSTGNYAIGSSLTNPASNFTMEEISGPSIGLHCAKLLNVFFIKVTSTEANKMNYFGKKSCYLNNKSFNTGLKWSSSFEVRAEHSNTPIGTFIDANVINVEHPILHTTTSENPGDFDVFRAENENYSRYPAIELGIEELAVRPENFQLSNQTITYYSYTSLYNNEDILSISLDNENPGYVIATSQFNTSITPTTFSVSNATSAYTYCYIAADILVSAFAQTTTNTTYVKLYKSRVFTPTYVCILKDNVSLPAQYITTRTHIPTSSMFNRP